MARLDEIRSELWRKLDSFVSDESVQKLQEEGNNIILTELWKSWDDLGVCPVKKIVLTRGNVAYDEVGLLRVASGKELWTKLATKEHDSIDWDDIAEKRLGQS